MQALGGIKYIFLTHRDDGELHMSPLCTPVFDPDDCSQILQIQICEIGLKQAFPCSCGPRKVGRRVWGGAYHPCIRVQLAARHRVSSHLPFTWPSTLYTSAFCKAATMLAICCHSKTYLIAPSVVGVWEKCTGTVMCQVTCVSQGMTQSLTCVLEMLHSDTTCAWDWLRRWESVQSPDIEWVCMLQQV